MLSNARHCRKCGIEKPLSKDYWQQIPNSTDGFRKTCLDCKSTADKQRYLKNKAAVIQRVSIWYVENKDAKREYDKNRRVELREKITEQKRIAHQKLLQKYPLKRLLLNIYMRGRKVAKNKKFAIRLNDVKFLLRTSNYSCSYCKQKFSSYRDIQFDHIIPLFRGGTHSVANLTTSCLDCNKVKAHRFIMEFRLNKVIFRKERR